MTSTHLAGVAAPRPTQQRTPFGDRLLPLAASLTDGMIVAGCVFGAVSPTVLLRRRAR